MSDKQNRSECWLGLYYPLLGLDLLGKSSAQVAAACLVSGSSKHQQVYRCNSQARCCGVKPGMALSAALAQCPSLQAHSHKPDAELQQLKKLAEICLDFSSRVSIEASSESLLLEVGASQRLWRPAFLRSRLQRIFREQGHVVYAALHKTPTGALLLARGRKKPRTSDNLDTLPLDVFPVDADIIRKLARVGVHTVKDYLALPGKDRILRFGPSLEQMAQKALGRIPDPRQAFQPPVRFQRNLELEYETDNAAHLLFYARRLLDELGTTLEQNCSTVQKLHWSFHHYRRPATVHQQQTLQPSRNMTRISLLLREQLERLPLPAAVEKISLRVNHFWPDMVDSLSLLRDMGQDLDAVEPLLEKLQARLGQQAIKQICALPDHRPEKAWLFVKPGQRLSPLGWLPPRPGWLLPEPRKLVNVRQFQHWRGPERITSGWWEEDIRRDYYRARHRNGVTYWLYRHKDQWFVHGVFG